MHTSRVEFAHVLRGVAAGIVLISHFFGVFWLAPVAVADLLKIPEQHWAVPAFVSSLHFSPALFNYGSLGVGIFFLISGFVIPFSLRSLSRAGFLCARFFRIFPVYWVALSVSLLAITVIQMMSVNQVVPFSMTHIVKQALLLRGWFGLPSIDGVSWTLEVEIVFYLFAAILAPWLLGDSGRKIIAGYSSLALLLCLAGAGFMNGFLLPLRYFCFVLPFTVYMFIGSLFHLHMRGKISSSMLLQYVMLLFFFFCVSAFSNSALKNISFNSYFIALVFFSGFYMTRASFTSNCFFDWLADISYPLYAVHALFGYSMMSFLLSHGWRPSLVVLITTVSVLSLAWLLHISIEQWVAVFGKNLAKRFFPKEESVG
jgi:peptidoglycan/LPS O-acetylase OafA/YrhL